LFALIELLKITRKNVPDKDRMKHAAVSLGISIALTATLVSFAAMLRAQDQPSVRTSDSSGTRQTEAAATFAGVCASCHGLDGRGGERGPDLATQPDVARKTDAELIKILRDGKTAAGMPSFASQGAARLSALVAYLRMLQGSSKGAPLPGDPARGKALFYGAARCSQCHMVNGQGGFYGSDLTAYAARISADEVRAAIVDPNKDLDPRRGLVTASLADSTTLVGLLRNQDNFSLQLQTPDGVFHLLNKADIRSLSYEGRSAMPSDYGALISREELNDLVSYLLRTSRSENTRKQKNYPEDGDEE
jgi:putative heme-binding domain-containing protein